MKFLKQSTYIRYVIAAKLSQLVQISMLVSSDSFSQRILWKWKRFWNYKKNKNIYFVMLHKLAQTSLPDCVYFPSYSIKCVSWFMHMHLMTSWHLNIRNFKILLSQEQKELSKWNKTTFSFVSQMLSFRCTKQTRKNEADTTLNHCFIWTSISNASKKHCK